MPSTTLQLDEQLEFATRAAERRQESVLLIEDSEDAMLLVEHALETCGDGRFRLLWETGLSDGLERLSRGGVDVVLLDLGLPECSGPASFAWVRELEPKTPVVVLTADAGRETKFSVLAGGAKGYLVKDRISGPALLEAIEAALQAP
jgi:CheY-like chemotaxis protein